MVGSIWLNWPGIIMDYFCSVDVNFWNKPLFGHMPCFVCYLVQAVHRDLGQASWYVSFIYSPCLREEWEIHRCPGTVRSYFDNSISKNSWVQKYPAVVAASSVHCERHILGTRLQLYLLCFSYRTNNNNRDMRYL